MRGLGGHLLLFAGLAAASCGGNTRDAALPSSASPFGGAASTSAGVVPTAVASEAPSSASPTPLQRQREMKSPVPSAMLASLQGLGLDPKDLPPIERLEPKALRGVMKLIAKSLGSKCGDCHREGDFALATPRKKIAARMWDEFVVKLVFAADDAPLFCDSCHQGGTQQLDRTDLKALGKWMDANFVAKLKRRDDKDHDCETCHIDWDMRFLTKWAGAPVF